MVGFYVDLIEMFCQVWQVFRGDFFFMVGDRQGLFFFNIFGKVNVDEFVCVIIFQCIFNKVFCNLNKFVVVFGDVDWVVRQVQVYFDFYVMCQWCECIGGVVYDFVQVYRLLWLDVCFEFDL